MTRTERLLKLNRAVHAALAKARATRKTADKLAANELLQELQAALKQPAADDHPPVMP